MFPVLCVMPSHLPGCREAGTVSGTSWNQFYGAGISFRRAFVLHLPSDVVLRVPLSIHMYAFILLLA